MYIYQKGSIAGPRLKIPFMGPFLDSVNPKFEAYKAKWDSGELSCVSVFHKSVPPPLRHLPCVAQDTLLTLQLALMQVCRDCFDAGHGPEGL